MFWVFLFSQSLLSFLSLSRLTGSELLYRNRDGDVVKFNVDTDEKTVLVHNKKFVSLLSLFLLLHIHRTKVAMAAHELN